MHWAAGFLEGEGSFCAVKSGQYKSQTVCCQQKQREPLERLQALFGGSICRVNGRNGRDPVFQWKISGARARGVMMTLFVLMSPRRKEQITETLAVPVRPWLRRVS